MSSLAKKGFHVLSAGVSPSDDLLALRMRRHMEVFGTTSEHLGQVAVTRRIRVEIHGSHARTADEYG